VPFHLSLALCDLGERLNANRCKIVDPGAGLRYGEENRVPGLEHWLGLGLMQDSLNGRERLRGAISRIS
jgi:hypothetical protein